MVDVEAFAAGDFQPARIEAELLQDRGVDVGDVVAIFDGVEADLVGRAVHDAPFDAAAGHPDGEAEDVMVAPVGALRAGRAAELGGEDARASRRACRVGRDLQAARRSADRRQAPAAAWLSLRSGVSVPSAGARRRHVESE